MLVVGSEPGPTPGSGPVLVVVVTLLVTLLVVAVSLSRTVGLHPGQACTLRSVLAGLIVHSVPLVTAVGQRGGKLEIILSYDLRCQSSHCGGDVCLS